MVDLENFDELEFNNFSMNILLKIVFSEKRNQIVENFNFKKNKNRIVKLNSIVNNLKNDEIAKDISAKKELNLEFKLALTELTFFASYFIEKEAYESEKLDGILTDISEYLDLTRQQVKSIYNDTYKQ